MWSGLMEERNAEGARLGTCFGKGKQWAGRQALPLGWRGGTEGPVITSTEGTGPTKPCGSSLFPAFPVRPQDPSNLPL